MVISLLLLAAVSVVSPDGKNRIEFDTERSAVRVLRNGTVRSGWTDVALTVDGKRLVARAACSVRKERKSGMAEAPVYKKAKVDLSANEAFAGFGDWGIRLVARNDGVAYRFETTLPGRVRIDGETAGLTIPDGATTAYVNFNNYAFDGDRFQCGWESVNETMRADAIATSEKRLVYLPLVFRYADGAVMSVTESDLHDYPGLNLERGSAADGVRLDGIFAAHPSRLAYGEGWGEEWMYSRTKRLRFRCVLERDDYLCETEGTRTFPWRVFQLAESPAKLLESDIVWALAKPSEGDFSWVKPGKVAWDWWNAFDNQGQKGCNTKTYERFIDFAAKNGVEYVIFDEGWSQRLDIWTYHPDVDVEHLIGFAKERGVGIILWMAWAQIDGEEERVAAHFAKLGAAGFKVDFMDRDDALCVGFIDRFAAACARHRLLLDYHGMYKPTGLQRAYPNVLNFEGVHGLENMKGFKGNCDFMANDLKCLFVRMSAGPMDYTPGAMDNYPVGAYAGTKMNPGSIGTRCRQMAMMTLFEAPLQMLCDSPTKYEANAECLRFMAATPVVWDATVGLLGDAETHAVLARRKDGVWHVAGITDAQARTVRVKLGFVGDGEYEMELFRDAPDADRVPTHYCRETRRVRSGEELEIAMAPGGGFALRLVRDMTDGLRRQIDAAAAAGGGRVVVPAGTWVTKPLRLKSGVELRLEKGARLVASGDLDDCPEWTDVRHIAHPEALPRGRNASLIFADEAHDIAITGEGTIDCNGAAFVREKTAKDWTGWRFERTVPPEKSLPRAVFFTGCSNVVIRGVTLVNPPAGWSYWFHDCDNVLVENADVKANVEYPNNDGYHVNSCRNVVIHNCDLETGDDSIVVRANNRTLAENKVCENVVISNCTLRSWSSAIRLGWTNDGLIRRCRFRDLRIRDTSVGVSFLLPKVCGTDYGREATRFEDIVFENIEMSGIVGRPILGFVADRSQGTRCAGFKDIVFRNVSASGLEKPLFRGTKDCPFQGFTFKGCRFETVPESALPDYRRHGAAAWDRFVGADDVFCDIRVK